MFTNKPAFATTNKTFWASNKISAIHLLVPIQVRLWLIAGATVQHPRCHWSVTRKGAAAPFGYYYGTLWWSWPTTFNYDCVRVDTAKHHSLIAVANIIFYYSCFTYCISTTELKRHLVYYLLYWSYCDFLL